MDEDLRKIKEQERAQWEETLSQLERSNLTINIGTGGGHVTDSDISIHELEIARRNINRLNAELSTDTEQPRYVDQRGVLELQLISNRRVQLIADRQLALEKRVRKIERKLSPTIRTTASNAASKGLIVALIISFFFDNVQEYCTQNPLYAFGAIVLVLLLAFLFWWIPQAPNGNGKP